MSKVSEEKFIGAMLHYEMQDKKTMTFTQLSKDFEFMDRSKGPRKMWSNLIDKNFIEPTEGSKSVYTGEYRLTQAGKNFGATPEYLEFVKEMNFVPQDNAQHQERIKKKLKNDKAREIFNLLQKYGLLSRQELAAMAKVNDRSHNFSYGLQDLVQKKLVEKVDKKLQLAGTAFLNPEDRPETVKLDQTVLDEARAVVEARKRGGKSANDESTSSPNKKGKIKKRKAGRDELGDEDETDDAADTDGQVTDKYHDKKKKKKAETEV